jgi:hypothetical protein
MFGEIQQVVYGVFASPAWESEGIPAVPANFQGETPAGIHVKISIVPGRPDYSNHSRGKCIEGLLILSIYTGTQSGEKDLFATADKLDAHFQSKRIGQVDFGVSTCAPRGMDPDNSTLFRGDYSISFTSHGE